MVGRSVNKKDEIWAYIKARSKLGCSLKKLITEISTAFGPSLSTKKVLYAIFFSGEGVAIKVPVKKGKSITGKYYKDVVLKKLKKYYQK